MPVEGSKGGAGKTTLASAIAVRAAEESKRVALIDADPQNSLYRWWGTAREPGNPAIYEADATSEAIELLISEGWEWVITDRIENAVALADFVLIPARASAPGIEAVDAVVDVCREHRKPFGFVLNAVQPSWRITTTAGNYLSKLGPVLNAPINYRQA